MNTASVRYQFDVFPDDPEQGQEDDECGKRSAVRDASGGEKGSNGGDSLLDGEDFVLVFLHVASVCRGRVGGESTRASASFFPLAAQPTATEPGCKHMTVACRRIQARASCRA